MPPQPPPQGQPRIHPTERAQPLDPHSPHLPRLPPRGGGRRWTPFPLLGGQTTFQQSVQIVPTPRGPHVRSVELGRERRMSLSSLRSAPAMWMGKLGAALAGRAWPRLVGFSLSGWAYTDGPVRNAYNLVCAPAGAADSQRSAGADAPPEIRAFPAQHSQHRHRANTRCLLLPPPSREKPHCRRGSPENRSSRGRGL